MKNRFSDGNDSLCHHFSRGTMVGFYRNRRTGQTFDLMSLIFKKGVHKEKNPDEVPFFTLILSMNGQIDHGLV